jgi:2-polyprenyl-3-methyl-5-hydroxy-6-metoxy-1,4-benzoquinol methylase
MSAVRREMERFLRWTMDQEPALLEPRLEPAEWEEFHRYYRSLPGPDRPAEQARFVRGFWRSEAGFVLRWLEKRPAPRVLDAGSGFGTFSMLYALGGAEVVGADLRPDRLSVAQKRLEVYRQHAGRALAVSYQRRDLTRDWPQDFDLVWVYNALSHIHPLPEFLARVRAHLKPGGVLVVGDINGDYLPHRRRLARERDQVYGEYVAPDGQRHAYAVEKTFGPAEVRNVMRSHGLRVTRHDLYWGGRGSAEDWLYHGLIEPVERLWWLGMPLARRQLVVAEVEGARR